MFCVYFILLVNYLNFLTVYFGKKKGEMLIFEEVPFSHFCSLCCFNTFAKHIFSLFSALVPYVGFELEFSPLDKMVHF